MSPVRHVFVLMLENRSFDHLFGLCGRPGIPRPQAPGFGPGAADRSPVDPPHEFGDVQAQWAQGTMSGFDPQAMLGFERHQLPVLNQLAESFVLFDNWFSSMPGPTWPNRFFVHAASSGGLATSPSAFQSTGAVILPTSPFRFENGTLFDRLDQAGLPWRVYHGDASPQVLALPGMVRRYFGGADEFRPLHASQDSGNASFADEVSRADYAPAYTFIEPDYAIGLFRQFYDGDSQHPRGKASSGDALLRHVYEALRASPIWEHSALLVTWDEHGGFFDHVPPPKATPPGDAPLNRPHGDDPGFEFDRLGPRVPALLISPHAPPGALGSALFPGATFDHASVVRSVFELFGLGAPLTARDRDAPSWLGCLGPGARPQGDHGPARLAARLPAPAGASGGRLRSAAAKSAAKAAAATADATKDQARQDVDGFLAGMGLIALDLDREVSRRAGRSPIANVKPQSAAAYERSRRASVERGDLRQTLIQYIQEVAVRSRAERQRRR